MDDKELIKITDSLTEKLGEEQSALIADDIGLLITANADIQKSIQSKDEEIAKLKSDKEKLVSANSNLLRQIPMGFEAPKPTPKPAEREETSSGFSFRDAFDEYGNFKK